MTYNKSEIMKRAWSAVKMGMTLSDALKASWKKAKQEVKEKHISERKDDVFYRCKVNKITSDDLIDTQMEIPAIYLPNAVWIMNKADLKALRKLKDLKISTVVMNVKILLKN